MKIAAICCTYKRPKQLATAIESFLRQDYPSELREMICLLYTSDAADDDYTV